jgi:hypothetical protein
MTDTPVPQTGSGTPADGSVPAQAPFIIKLAIVVFTTAYLLAALALLLDFWVLGQTHLKQSLGLAQDRSLPPLFLSALHAMVGAVLGAGVLDIVSFHHYASKGDFEARHVWGYFVSPLLAAVLGLVVFALLQSGLLVFAGGAQDKADDVARLGYLALGFLAGFGWYEATQSIRRIVQRFFSGGGAEAEPPPAPTIPPAPPTPPAPPPEVPAPRP